MSKQDIIQLKNVHKSYQLGEVEFEALKGIDVKVKKNEFLSITGPSGSGKSTMLNMIGALDRPSQGKVLVKNNDISKLNDNQLATLRGKTIGFVFQTFNLIPRLTTVENITLPMWFIGNTTEGERKKRAKKLLEMVGLGDKIKNNPTQLSGGERQRLAIARALANKPEIILADEPTGNLDTKTGKKILDILKKLHKKEEVTLVIVSHDKKIANQAKRQVKIKDGKIGG